jgi:hypothetical protein
LLEAQCCWSERRTLPLSESTCGKELPFVSSLQGKSLT